MRINSIIIPKHITEEFGLSRLEMKDLGRIVIIAGKNGSGKTRLLNLIKNNSILIDDKFTENRRRVLSNLSSTRKALDQAILSITTYNEKGLKNLTPIEKQDYDFFVQKEKEFKESILKDEKDLKIEFLKFEEGLPRSEIFEFIPKRVDLKDPNDLTKKETKKFFFSDKPYKIEELPEITYAFIQNLQEISVNNSDPKIISESDKIKLEKYKKKFVQIKELIKIFLGSEIRRNILGDTEIFDKPFNESNLSEGQRILLQLCVGLLENETSLTDAIILLDEPENHLHPKILIDVIEKMLAINKNGQIWIATHSIPLIAHFDPSFLWLMEENGIYFAGRSPEKVIDNLVGDEDKERLTDFLNLPAVFASTKFAAECLLPAAILNTGSNDPQTNQIFKIIQQFILTNGKVKVLDYGAGKGRLIKQFLQMRAVNSDDYNTLDYYAYDLASVKSEIKDECINAINSFYPKNKRHNIHRYLSSNEQMFFKEDDMFDVIIMCNVFHEIDPRQWMTIFSKEDVILRHLKTNGFVLIVEDQQMPVGEKAYQNGFMVFNELQFRKLFNIKSDDKYESFDARNDKRLMAHLIPRKNIETISNNSIAESIKCLKKEALIKIDEIRSCNKSDFKTGLKLSFWLHQFANSNLNLSSFRKKS